MSDKVKSQHIGRKALLYVRQSSTYQVNHNLESQKLQYAMRQRLQILGWREIDSNCNRELDDAEIVGGHLSFWTKPPKVVWNLLLQAGSEGPTLISQTVAHLLSLSAVCCARGTL